MRTETTELFDVVAVDIATSEVTALLGTRQTLPNAEAIVSLAVLRRGVEKHFYAEVPHGKFNVGDTYSP